MALCRRNVSEKKKHLEVISVNVAQLVACISYGDIDKRTLQMNLSLGIF